MSTSFTFIDNLIRDYFQYRCLTTTSRLFDNELSKLPLGQYRADRIIERLTVSIHQFDINNLIDYWAQIEQHLLSTFTTDSQRLINVFTKIRLNLYRCYLIHAVQSTKMDKINEFFERLTKVLQQSNAWTKEWFALPFIKNPEEHLTFKVYFSKQWNELFWTSLQNFLAIAFYHMSSPKICSLEEDNPQSKPFIPSFAGMAIDDSQQCQANLTITSKLRSKFLPNTKQTVTHNKLPSFSTSSKPIIIRTSSTDDSITTLHASPLSPRAKSATIT